MANMAYPPTVAAFLHTGDMKASSPGAVGPVKGWDLWDLMKDDQIPLSLTSLSVALLVMVLGLILNVLVVLMIVRGLKFVEKSNKTGSPICTCSIKNSPRKNAQEDETLRRVVVDCD